MNHLNLKNAILFIQTNDLTLKINNSAALKEFLQKADGVIYIEIIKNQIYYIHNNPYFSIKIDTNDEEIYQLLLKIITKGIFILEDFY